MKATNLMIGDIVAVNNTPLQISALGTAKAGFIDAKGEMFYHYYDNIEPIPLTAEILEKNGFIFNEIICKWEVEKTAFAIYKGRVDKAKFAIEYWKDEDDCMFVWIANSIVPLRHVHELQHALKLCGIEKQINL